MKGSKGKVFAVLSTGGKQYRVAENDRIVVESLDSSEGDKVVFKEILLLADKGNVTFGSPFVSGASVKAKVLGQGKGPKINALVYKCRKRYRRRFGHRQRYTELLIEKIEARPKSAAPKTARKAPEKEKGATKERKQAPKSGD